MTGQQCAAFATPPVWLAASTRTLARTASPQTWRGPTHARALEDTSALSVTSHDAHLDAADEQAIFEPGVGELPLLDEITLTALFHGDTDALALLAALESFDPALAWSRVRFLEVDGQDWKRAWLGTFQPMRFEARTWIMPSYHEISAEADAASDPVDSVGAGSVATVDTWLAHPDADRPGALCSGFRGGNHSPRGIA